MSERLTEEEQADQDLAMDWTSEAIPSWRNAYDLIRRVRENERERCAQRLLELNRQRHPSGGINSVISDCIIAIRSAPASPQAPQVTPP